jgi:phosphoglycerol transferase MdoB-like AlkP superfamily enzyme
VISRLKKLIFLYFTTLFLFTLVRVSLFLLYESDFNLLNKSEVLKAFLMGVKVDVITISTLFLPLILLFLLPFKFADNRSYQKVLTLFWWLFSSILLFVLIGDLIYFKFVHRHLTKELILLGNDFHIVLDMVKEYKFWLFVYLILILFLYRLFRYTLDRFDYKEQISLKKRLLILFFALLALFITIRGKVEGKPFSIADAFISDKTASGNLALNGVYTMYRTYSNKKKRYKFFSDDEAVKNVRELLEDDRFKFVDKRYPIMRNIATDVEISDRKNVVIILLESWSSKYVDSFGGNGFRVTPNFDSLAKEGVKFSNFFANGQRSIEGITSLFSGLPILVGMDMIGSGLELTKLKFIADIFKENGYHTISMQSSDRGSFRVDSISKLSGFDEYYGAEDMDRVGDEDRDKSPKFGTWDGDMYNHLIKTIDKTKEPFFAFAFTSTTHIPFILPGKKWERYTHDNDSIEGFLNTLYYADDKLGEFMDRCKKREWFDRTIFIFLADHTIGFGDDSKLLKNSKFKIKKRELEEMRIPLLIYAPKILKPKTVDRVASQADIIPTLIDMLSLKGHFATVSNSLFSQNRPFALLKEGSVAVMVRGDGYLKHTLKRSLESSSVDDLEKPLFSIYQFLDTVLRENRVIK